MAKLEADAVRLKSLDVPALSKRLEVSELKQKQQEKQLASLEQSQTSAASIQGKIAKRQGEMKEQIENIILRLSH